ncbi:MAG: hypothetical protein QCH35_04770 [Methanomicrobiaceae archaeon]|nr:hypothetical protein [Methanomicrobiaceae archaeon]
MTKKIGSTPAILCIIGVLAVACGAGCFSADRPPEDPAPAPTFHQHTEGYDDRVVFSVIPYSDTRATYVVDCEILRNGTTVEARTDAVFESISQDTPIVFEVPRTPDDRISLEIEVRNTDGDVLHTSTTVVGPARQVPASEGTPLAPATGAAGG